MEHSPQGSTRPFSPLRLCARLGYAALALLQPDLALAAAPLVALLRRRPATA